MNRKKKQRKKRNPKTLVVLFAVMAFFIVELLFYTWCRVQSVRVKYQIAAETAKHEHLVELRDNLKIEIARLKSPRRITEIARRQLGLTTPTAGQIVSIP